MPSPHPLDTPASPAAAHRRRRLRHLKRALAGSGALFAVLFCLLAAQMVLGRDPAVGEGQRTQKAAAPAAGGGGEEASVLDLALGVVRALAEGDDRHEDGGRSAPLQSRAS